MKAALKKLGIFLGSMVLLLLLLYLFRFPIMRSMANYLVCEDEYERVDAAFVLGGEQYERAKKAVEIYRKHYAQNFVLTGIGVSEDFRVAGQEMKLSELTRQLMLQRGVDSAAIVLLDEGSSTFEESEAILTYAQMQDWDKIMLISSRFHTRRIQSVFREKFEAEGIRVIIVGADPVGYSIKEWWKYEKAMIFLNNEYIKLVYYAFKYP